MSRPGRVAVACIPVILSCSADSGDAGSRRSERPVPPASCQAAWRDPSVTEFVDLLEKATPPGSPIWGTYDLGDGHYVVLAGESDTGTSCVGAWHAGEPLGFADLPEPPTMLTPLYGYHLTETGNGGPFDDLVPAAEQPASVQAWLGELGVPSAVVMPVNVDDFPMEIPTLTKVQLAIHEGFHVTVQSPRWLGTGGEWPEWDLQPDRAALQACYTASPGVEEAIGAEREALYGLVDALLEGDRPTACRAGEEFLARRDERYAELSTVRVARHDGTPGDCGEAEGLMELEEGTADYASWVSLYDLGLASRDRLAARYEAQQNDWFYLSGAMQWHAVQLLAPDRMLDITRQVATSAGPAEGAPTAILTQVLAEACR